MKCSLCGCDVKDGVVFCDNCNATIDRVVDEHKNKSLHDTSESSTYDELKKSNHSPHSDEISKTIYKTRSTFPIKEVLIIASSIIAAVIIAIVLIPSGGNSRETDASVQPTTSNREDNQESGQSLFIYTEASESTEVAPQPTPAPAQKNDSASNAFMLQFDNELTGDMRINSNNLIWETWYYVDMPREGILNVSVVTTDDLQIDVGIWVSQGMILSGINSSYNDREKRHEHLERGQYHINVRHKSGAGLYTITASFIESGNTTQPNENIQNNDINMPIGRVDLNTLSNEIQYTDNWVRVTAIWIEGQYKGTNTVFERAEDSNLWTMESRSGGTSSINAVFSNEHGIFAIIVSGQSPWSYYLHEDGTGYMIHPNGTTRENFTWNANHGDNADFILPFSSQRLLIDDDLRGLSKENLRIARNEIYARYGYQFNSQYLQNYFDTKSWYNNLTKLPIGTEPSLSTLEHSNLSLILDFEAGKTG